MVDLNVSWDGLCMLCMLCKRFCYDSVATQRSWPWAIAVHSLLHTTSLFLCLCGLKEYNIIYLTHEL